MKKVLYVSSEGGHYLLTDDDQSITISRWEGDGSWTNPGEIVLEFHKHNGDITLCDYEIKLCTLAQMKILAEYLGDGWIEEYTRFEGSEL